MDIENIFSHIHTYMHTEIADDTAVVNSVNWRGLIAGDKRSNAKMAPKSPRVSGGSQVNHYELFFKNVACFQVSILA